MKFLLLFVLLTNHYQLIAQDSKTTDTDDLYFYKTSVIQGYKYSGLLTNTGFVLLKNERDTLIKSPEIYFSLKFEDFDQDGFKDLFLDKGGNTPERYDLFLYNSTTKKFKQVLNFEKFPDPISVKGTKYFYSYHRNGCADNDWVSDLFIIKNFEAIRVGKIDGVGCGSDNLPTAIYIYKITKEKKALIATLPITTINDYKEYKWGFIKKYWSKNYLQFN